MTIALTDSQRTTIAGNEYHNVVLGSKLYILRWLLFTSGVWCLKVCTYTGNLLVFIWLRKNC